jgi:hypothetical protein
MHRETDKMVRSEALALGLVAAPARNIVAELVQLLRTGQRRQRQHAARLLGAMGPAGQGAIPALLEASDQRDEETAAIAVAALEQVARIAG